MMVVLVEVVEVGDHLVEVAVVTKEVLLLQNEVHSPAEDVEVTMVVEVIIKVVVPVKVHGAVKVMQVVDKITGTIKETRVDKLANKASKVVVVVVEIQGKSGLNINVSWQIGRRRTMNGNNARLRVVLARNNTAINFVIANVLITLTMAVKLLYKSFLLLDRQKMQFFV